MNKSSVKTVTVVKQVMILIIAQVNTSIGKVMYMNYLDNY